MTKAGVFGASLFQSPISNLQSPIFNLKSLPIQKARDFSATGFLFNGSGKWEL